MIILLALAGCIVFYRKRAAKFKRERTDLDNSIKGASQRQSENRNKRAGNMAHMDDLCPCEESGLILLHQRFLLLAV